MATRRPRRQRRRRDPESGGTAPAATSTFGTRTQRLVVAGLILVAVVVGVWLLLGQGRDAPRSPTAAVAPTSRPVPTFPAAERGGGTVGLFIQPEDGRPPVLEEIEAARRTITLEVYLLSDEETIAALEAAAARGVEVRVILEEHPFGGAGNQPEVFARLDAAGVDIRWSNPAFRFTHIKTLVVDGEVALIMNQNLTFSSFTRNREFGVITTRPAEVAEAAAIFEADWSRSVEPPPGPLVVSPTDSRQELLALIDSADQSLEIYAEVVRDREMMDAIIAAAGRGVAVRLVMSGDPGDDNAEERLQLAAAGVEVRLARGVYIHAKIFLVDGARVFVGSQNMTATSLDQNRELGIILDEPGIIGRVARTFEEDFANGEREAVS